MSQKPLQLKRQKAHTYQATPSLELLPPNLKRHDRQLSMESFRNFQNSLSKLKLATKSSSLHKLNKEMGSMVYPRSHQNAVRQSKVEGIDNRLRQKLLVDEQIDYVLGRQIKQCENKKNILEKKLSQIRTRNNLRIKQIQDFQERVVEKYKAQYNKDKEQYNKLTTAFNKVVEHQKLLEIKHVLKKQKASQDRDKIMEEQKRFINFINNLKNEDIDVTMQSSEVLHKYQDQKQKYQQIKKQPDISQNTDKPTNAVKRNGTRQKADLKQIGDLYLQQNKAMAMKNKKFKQANYINLKSIDYNADVKNKLQNNQRILSIPPAKSLQTTISNKSQISKTIQSSQQVHSRNQKQSPLN